MKKKSKKTLKVFLVGVSVVLVTAISVGLTLAYLTAQTDPIKNDFTAKGDISGRLAEPAWKAQDALKIAPGKKVAKNPVIDNETGDTYIWVGARMEFTIDIGDTTSKTVDYATFTHFVALENYNPSTSWYEYTDAEVASKTSDTTKKLYKYYIYKTILEPDKDGTAANPTLTNADVTTPLFTSVTPDVGIIIKSGGTATNTNLTASATLANLTFKKFDFDINIKGYGIKAYKSATDADALDEIDDVKAEMLTQLVALT